MTVPASAFTHGGTVLVGVGAVVVVRAQLADRGAVTATSVKYSTVRVQSEQPKAAGTKAKP
jgi:hypothetical protein